MELLEELRALRRDPDDLGDSVSSALLERAERCFFAWDMDKGGLADEIAGDIQIIRAHALEAAAKDDLGNRAFWWQLYIGVVMAYARGLFTRQQTIIDQRVQQIVIPNVDQFYRDIRELRRQTPPLALPPGIEADNEVDEVDQYLREYGTDISYPTEVL